MRGSRHSPLRRGEPGGAGGRGPACCFARSSSGPVGEKKSEASRLDFIDLGVGVQENSCRRAHFKSQSFVHPPRAVCRPLDDPETMELSARSQSSYEHTK